MTHSKTATKDERPQSETQNRPAYEYIRLAFDFGDLGQLNRYSTDGWRVIAVTERVPLGECHTDQWRCNTTHYALLERTR